MTAAPVPPARQLTVAEFAALPEDNSAHYELQEGNIVMSPRARPDHQACEASLVRQLAAQVPPELEVLPEIDLDLGLAAPSRPGFVRAPDIVVVDRAGRRRVRAEGGLIRASEVVLVVEILSPGTRRTDSVIKRGEYSDAGIAHYWLIDLDDGPCLTVCHPDGTAARHTGRATIAEPFPLELDLDALT